MTLLSYREFLEAKRPRARVYGAPVPPCAVHPIAKPHQDAIVRWMVQGGRRAVFANFGLGKGLMQQEAMRLTIAHGGGSGLIVCPLGVRADFMADAAMLSIDLREERRDIPMLFDALESSPDDSLDVPPRVDFVREHDQPVAQDGAV